MIKRLTLLATGLFIGLLSFSQPIIQSFQPASGQVNTPVTITGTGFSAVAADNIVYFGATRATVTASTATTITTTVPVGATYQPITVTTNNLTGYSVLPFIVTGDGNGAGQPLTSTSFVPSQNVTTGYYPHGVAVGDFNQDGKVDLVVAKGSSTTVSVLTNTTTGNTFSFNTPLEVTAAGNSHEDVATGDLDGDGKLDFVTANTWNTNSVSVFRNTTTGSTISFAAKTDLTVVGSPYGVAIGDVDGDGKPDVVAVNSTTGANVISVMRNTSTPGNLSFADKIDFPGGVGPFNIKIADLDADGKAEIVVTGQYSSSSHLSVLKNNSTVGNISFQAPTELAIVGGPFSVAVGDLNSDGKPDIVAASAFSNAVVVKRNTSTPGILSFAGTIDYLTTGSYPEGVAIADIDGDGKPDVVATNNSGNTVSVLRNTNTSTSTISFASRVDYAVGAYPNIVACGDLDGDSRADIIVANTSATYVSILKNIIGANVAPAISSFTPTVGVNGTTVTITGANFGGTTAVKFGGVDATSFTVNSSTSITAVVGPGASGEVSVTTSIGTAVLAGFTFNGPIISSFTPATGISGTAVTIFGTNFTGATAVSFGGVAATSFTVNSSTSITAVVGLGATGDVSVTTPTGTGIRPGFSFGKPSIISFTPATAPVGATVTITGTNFSTVANENTVFFGSVKSMVLSATATQLTVEVPAGAIYAPVTVTTNHLTAYSSLPFSVSFTAVNRQLTANSFTKVGNYGTGAYPVSVYSTDLNDDGKPELITANAIGSTISILKNLSTTGTVSFSTKQDYSVTNDPKRIAFGDLDGDGRPDLATISFNQGSASTLSVFRNTSTGGNISFAVKKDFSTGNGSLGLGIADISGDGKPDIVVTSGNSGFISIFENTTVGSTITFAAKKDYTLLKHPDDLILADLDNDGRTDIITSNFSDDNVSVFRNTSTGGILSLGSPYDFAVGDFPGNIAAGDVDLDGKLDLLVRSNGNIAFLKNYSSSGYISLGSPTNFAVPSSWNVSVGDLNGDGKPDIASGQQLSGKASIFENTTAATGNLSLGAKVDLTGATFDTYAAIGDLDGDGKPEVITANTTIYTVTILKNNIDGPTVTQFTPTTTDNGNSITIIGTGFNNVSSVTFGGTPASSFTVASSTRIDASVGAGASGDVSVTTPNGTGSLAGFKFIPAIMVSGPISFCNGSSVTFTSTAAANNKWYKDGIFISGAVNNTYTATVSGTYTVSTTSNGVTTTSPTGIVVATTTVPKPTTTYSNGVLTSSSATGNQWYLNGVAIALATAQTYQPAEYGVYTVNVTANGCTSAFSAGFTYNITGTIDLGGNQYVKLWPNPVQSNLIVQWNVNNVRALSVEIRDMYGKLVLYNQSVNSGEAINVTALPTGTYFVKVYGNQKPLGALKILKVN